MSALKRFVPILLVAGFLLAACGGGGGGTTVSLLFEAPRGSGFADGQVNNVPVAPSVQRDFTFATGVSVSGRITDSSGAPIADARVAYHLSTTAPAVDSDTTDSLGNYSVTLSGGSWVVVIRAGDALGTITVTGVPVAAPGPVVHDFAFPPRHAVTGFVRDSFGAGIDGAEVAFTGSRSGARVTVDCDGSGAYSAALVPDTYQAVVTPTDPAALTHLKQRFTGIVINGPTARDFMLVRGVLVSGTVFDDFGVPLQEDTDVRVQLAQDSPFFAPDRVTADGDTGTYAIGPLPLDVVTFLLEPPGDSGFPAQRFSRRILGPATQVEDFTLQRGYVLSGTIRRDDGATPEGNVEVELVPTNGALTPDDDETDGNGRYEISLFPGTYEMHLTPRPDNLQLPEIRSITISGPTVLDVTLQRGAMVQGTVRDPSGTPAQDIRVEIRGVPGASDRTDGAGQYSFLAPAGTHTLSLTAEDGPFEDMALTPVAGVVVSLPGPILRDIMFTLATTGSRVISGTVFAPDGATTVSGVVVDAMDTNGAVVGKTFSDPSGRYVLVIE